LDEHAASIFWVYQSKKSALLLLGCQNLKIEEKHSSKIAVNIYQSSQHNTPEDLNLHNALVYSCEYVYFPS
jgi:hypothetical protein